jgi:hypothetical protein
MSLAKKIRSIGCIADFSLENASIIGVRFFLE